MQKIHPATLEELRQEASEAQATYAALNPNSYDGQRVIAGLQRLRQEIHESEQAIHSLSGNYSA